MVLVAQRTRLKNRIHSTLSKCGIPLPEVSDLFGRRGRQELRARLSEMLPQTGFVISRLLEQVKGLDRERGKRTLHVLSQTE